MGVGSRFLITFILDQLLWLNLLTGDGFCSFVINIIILNLLVGRLIQLFLLLLLARDSNNVVGIQLSLMISC